MKNSAVTTRSSAVVAVIVAPTRSGPEGSDGGAASNVLVGPLGVTISTVAVEVEVVAASATIDVDTSAPVDDVVDAIGAVEPDVQPPISKAMTTQVHRHMC
jgi:hypothetical protein